MVVVNNGGGGDIMAPSSIHSIHSSFATIVLRFIYSYRTPIYSKAIVGLIEMSINWPNEEPYNKLSPFTGTVLTLLPLR